MIEYEVPPPDPEPRQRYVVVTDPAEIAAIKSGELRAPIGGRNWKDKGPKGEWRAEEKSLLQWRRKRVEFNV